MKKCFASLGSVLLLCSFIVSPVYATENFSTSLPKAEIISTDKEAETLENEGIVNCLTDKTRGTKRPSTDSIWDIYLQDYVFNLDFDTAVYSNYNFSNHGGEIKVSVTCESSNPNKIKMELYAAGTNDCRATLELNSSGTTTGRFYNLDLKTNYYFKFVTPDEYSVQGEGRLYK